MNNADLIIEDTTLVLYTGQSAEHVTVPTGVCTIGKDAFNGTDVQSVLLPNSLTRIEARAFEGCSELHRINFPSSLRSIGEDAFRECTDLCSVHFADGLEDIGSFAFSESGIRTVILPPGMRRLRRGVFSYCPNLRTALLGEIEVLEAAFYGSVNLKDVVIPDTLRKMQSCRNGDNFLEAFEFCTNVDVKANDRWKQEHEYLWYRIQRTIERAKEDN